MLRVKGTINPVKLYAYKKYICSRIVHGRCSGEISLFDFFLVSIVKICMYVCNVV